MDTKINEITQLFLDSYHGIGGINYLDELNLPSRDTIHLIVNDIESLVFPGFKTEAALERVAVPRLVSEKVRRLIHNLQIEINRSLSYEQGIGDQTNRFEAQAKAVALQIVASIPQLRQTIRRDVEAAFAGDPAAKSHEEVMLSYPAIEAITIYRIAHLLWLQKIPLIPRLMTEFAHSRTGIDIHPGATIGESFFIDHGTGVVIGESTIIGNQVKLYQGVTLGALSVKKQECGTKRHPTLENEVTVYSGATILGGQTVVGRGSIIGGNVWLVRSVAAYSVVTIKESDYVIREKNDHYIDFQI